MIYLSCYSFYHEFKKCIPELRRVDQRTVFTSKDLVIFPGGEDVSPELYGQKNTDSGNNVERDSWETYIFQSAQKVGAKMFGVCRGSQFLNVMLGGTLIQDLRKAGVQHAGVHGISYVEDSWMRLVYPDVVNSLHHQGYLLENLAPSLWPIAVEPSTMIVESYLSVDSRVMAVQFHPEFLDNGPEFFKGLFENFYTGE